jgi:hypothetical protein
VQMERLNEECLHIVGQHFEKGLYGVMFDEREFRLYALNPNNYVEFNFCPICGKNIRKLWEKWNKRA